MTQKCDKGLIMKIHIVGKEPLEFRNVGIDVYESLKRDLCAGRPFLEFSGVVMKDDEACNKMSLIPSAHIHEITIEEQSTPEKEGRK